MGAFIGFILGYVVGVKDGHARYEEIMRAWTEITSSKEFRSLMSVVDAIMSSKTVGGKAMEMKDAWSSVAGSPELSEVLASGTAVFSRVFKDGIGNGVAGRVALVFQDQLKTVVTELMKTRRAA